MTTTEQRLADALRAVIDTAPGGVRANEADNIAATWDSILALAAYDAQQAHDVAAGAWSANAGSVWDHTGRWIADCDSENAARIVQCVNAHDALVSALRGCVERLGVVIESDTDDAPHGASPDDVAAYEAGRAALANVGGAA